MNRLYVNADPYRENAGVSISDLQSEVRVLEDERDRSRSRAATLKSANKRLTVGIATMAILAVIAFPAGVALYKTTNEPLLPVEYSWQTQQDPLPQFWGSSMRAETILHAIYTWARENKEDGLVGCDWAKHTDKRGNLNNHEFYNCSIFRDIYPPIRLLCSPQGRCVRP